MKSFWTALFSACVITLQSIPAHCAAVISGVRQLQHGAAIELRFKLRGNPRWHLSRHGTELWIDLEGTRLDLPPRPLFGQELAPISTVRVIDAGNGKARVIVAVRGKSDYAATTIPGNLIVRLAPAGAAPDIAEPIPVRFVAPHPRIHDNSVNARMPVRNFIPLPKPRGPDSPDDSASIAKEGVRHARVMIDAGHGGYDPGTRSLSNVLEKDCALQIATRLANVLRARGVSTSLTRDGDYFVSLAERTRRANRADADLFVSIHLNWSPNPATSGIEVYYLNNTTDRATIRLARMENLSGAGDGVPGKSDLNYILSDLKQNDKASESASLAEMIDSESASELRAEFGAGVRTLGAKRGPFYVLVGADMPAVLIECGFLSNPAEAARLANPQYQADLAQAIAGSVIRFLNADTVRGNL